MEVEVNLEEIYKNDFQGSFFKLETLKFWEESWLLEKHLIQALKEKQQKHIIMMIISLINLKQLEQIQNIEIPLDVLEIIFNFITNQNIPQYSLEEKTQIYTFLMYLYCQPENQFVSKKAYVFVSKCLLMSSNPIFLKFHFLKYPELIKDYVKASKVKNWQSRPESKFIPSLVEDLIQMLFNYPISEQNLIGNDEVIQIESQNQFRTFLERNTAPLPTPKHIIKAQNEKILYRLVDEQQMRYLKCIEKMIDFLTLLLSSIPTRKFLRIYLLSTNLLPYLKCSMPQHHSCVLQTLVQSFEHYINFPLNDVTGEQLSFANQQMVHKDFLKKLQTVLYKKFKFMVQQKELEEYQFVKNLRRSEIETMFQIMILVFPLEPNPQQYSPGKNFDSLILEVIRSANPIPNLQSYLIDRPLIPNEQMIWDYKFIPEESESGLLKQVLSIPKLNLQFLCFDDYLERNYKLLKLESSFDLRKEFEDAVIRVDPQFNHKGGFTQFNGYANMATQVVKFKIHEVETPEIGKRVPRKVYGEVQFHVDRMSQQVLRQWDNLRKHQIVFLVAFRKEIDIIQFKKDYDEREEIIKSIQENDGCKQFCEKYGIRAIRGAEIDIIYDERRREIKDSEIINGHKFQGNLRIFNVFLDAAQYQDDVDAGINAEGEIYGNFSLLIRRNPKENNFKQILGAIQRVIIQPPILPPFLQSILLGYCSKDVSSSNYFMTQDPSQVQFNLLDTIIDQEHLEILKSTNLPKQLIQQLTTNWQPVQKNRNQIRFTKLQLQSIVSSMYPGLTLVVGPPGTGKTDISVQIASLLYHNFPNQKTLIITHSNYALNDLFEKISQHEVDEKYMLRLGIGAKELKLNKVFSREGRINYMLQRRLYLLDLVLKLQKSIQIPFAEEYSCEIAEYYFKAHIQRLWNNYQQKQDQFPFQGFVNDYPNLFIDQENTEKQYKVIQQIFQELKECRPFELLRNKKERGLYVICHQARIIAMTCTHAALKRNSFYDYDFQYDNIIFEEAGQILEIEAFLPLTMSKSSSLKRVIMIGDHNQLPPVIKNVSFQKIANMEQSFFIRMIRLGIHHHVLEEQGRTRNEILQLYKWKYNNLTSLRHINFNHANAGLSQVFQFVDIDIPENKETRPLPYFYQNIIEAEFVVATYMYLVCIGYNPKQISILTTYNAQKLLIKDIISRKCAWHSFFQSPDKINTVDKFQGQQNDIILLSMVRTENPGYLKDIRRIIISLSRAKYGLYIFGKYNLFSRIPELSRAFQQFVPGPLKLIPNETYPTQRLANDEGKYIEISHPDALYELIRNLMQK